MAAKDDLGRHGEELAAQFLADAGYTVIDRNWRCPRGEIDLVASDGNDTVFVEVKTRSSTAFGHPFEAITTQKIARLRRLAVAWCEAHPERRAAAHSTASSNRVSSNSESGNNLAPNVALQQRSASRGAIRIDAISVIAPVGKVPVIEHLRQVF